MTADTITPNHGPRTYSDDLEGLGDREILARICHQLDHLDQLAHDVARFHDELAPLIPLIPRALALLDPMASIRGRKGRRHAVPQPEAAPVHVGAASAHSPEVGA